MTQSLQANSAFLAQQLSQDPGMAESQIGGADDGESAAVTAFLEFMDKTPEEHAFDAFLGSRGMTQEEFEALRSEEHTSELQSVMRISYAVIGLKKKIAYILRHHFHVIS